MRRPRRDLTNLSEAEFRQEVIERLEDLKPKKSIAKRLINYGVMFIMGMAGLHILAAYMPVAAVALTAVSMTLGFALGTIPGWMLLGAGGALAWARKRDREGRAPKWYLNLKERLAVALSGKEKEATGVGSSRPGVQRSTGQVQPYRRGPAGWVERTADELRGQERVVVRRTRVAGGQRQTPAAGGGVRRAPRQQAAPDRSGLDDFGALGG